MIVITGASAGVGRATARELARPGAALALVARGREGLEAAQREAIAAGAQAMACPLDVADAGAVEAAAERIERELGPIDLWINNAMVSVFSPVKQLQPEEVRRVTEVTYLGTVNGTLAALKRMLPRDRGVILQVGSALAYRSIPLQAAYCGAKHAIAGFTQSLRCELLHDHSRVRVVIVQMPALNTPQFGWVRSRLPEQPQPVPPIYQPEVAARAIAWAAKHEGRETWVGYSTWLAIGGVKLAAGLGDHYLARNGYAAQQTGTPAEPGRRDNLFEPVPGDAGAHGSFDARARHHSASFELRRHAWAPLAMAGGWALWLASRRRRRRQPQWKRLLAA